MLVALMVACLDMIMVAAKVEMLVDARAVQKADL